MNILKSHSRALTIAATATAALAGLVFFFKKSLNEGNKVKQEEVIELSGPILSETDKLILLKELKLDVKGTLLSVPEISKVLVAALKFAGPRFREITRRFRNARRSFMDDQEEYTRLCVEYSDSVEELLNQTQDEILKEVGIPDEIWEESNKLYLTQGRQDLMALHLSLPHHLKMGMKPGKDLDSEDFKEILTKQIELLKKEGRTLNEITAFIGDQEKASEVIQHKINDLIYEEFAIEEEDTLAAVKKHKDDPKIQQLLMDFQRVSLELEPTN